MRALYAWLLGLQDNGWFTPTYRFPIPGRWQGWAALAALILCVAATAGMAPEAAWPVRIVLGAVYFALAFWSAGGKAP
jgi:hypothetical protein